MRSKTGGCGRLVRSERQRRICLPRYVQRLKELYEQALNDIQKKDEQAEECRHQLQETTENLRSQEKAAREAQSKCRELEETCERVHAEASRT